MTPFTYLRPSGLDEAMSMLAEHGATTKVMAGGQNLLLALKERLVRPSHVLSLAGVPGLCGHRYTSEGELEIGSGTTYAQLATSKFEGWHSEISTVAFNLADRSVRNMGTIGGAACQADPRYDIPTLLVGTHARLTVQSVLGQRVVPAAGFFNPEGGTNLAANEILSCITFPAASAFAFVGFEKFRYRVFDAAVVNMVLALATDPVGKVSAASLVAGNAAKCPSIASQAAARLIGHHIASLGGLGVADAASEEILPIASASTRNRQLQSELLKTLAINLLNAASARTGS